MSLPTKYKFENDSIIMKGYNQLKNNQKKILEECLRLKTGAMALPMGYGKTIISLILAMIQSKSYENSIILFVLSKTLILNLVDEIQKFFGEELKYDILHRDYVNINSWNMKNRIIITTSNVLSKYYNLHGIDEKFIHSEWSDEYNAYVNHYLPVNKPILSYENGVQFLYSTTISVIVTDESQGYYNMSCTKGKCIASLCAKHRWLLSGTLIDEPRIDKIFGYFLALNHPTAPRNLPDFKGFITNDEYGGIRDTMVYSTENEEFTPPTSNMHIVAHKLIFEEIMIYENTKKICCRWSKFFIFCSINHCVSNTTIFIIRNKSFKIG